MTEVADIVAYMLSVRVPGRHEALQPGLDALAGIVMPRRPVSRPREDRLICRLSTAFTRILTMDTIKPLFTATATATGGRTGTPSPTTGW